MPSFLLRVDWVFVIEPNRQPSARDYRQERQNLKCRCMEWMKHEPLSVLDCLHIQTERAFLLPCASSHYVGATFKARFRMACYNFTRATDKFRCWNCTYTYPHLELPKHISPIFHHIPTYHNASFLVVRFLHLIHFLGAHSLSNFSAQRTEKNFFLFQKWIFFLFGAIRPSTLPQESDTENFLFSFRNRISFFCTLLSGNIFSLKSVFPVSRNLVFFATRRFKFRSILVWKFLKIALDRGSYDHVVPLMANDYFFFSFPVSMRSKVLHTIKGVMRNPLNTSAMVSLFSLSARQISCS